MYKNISWHYQKIIIIMYIYFNRIILHEKKTHHGAPRKTFLEIFPAEIRSVIYTGYWICFFLFSPSLP